MRRFLIVAAAIVFYSGQAFGNATGTALSLEQMAQQKFTAPPLSEAEKRVVHHASDGTIADCRDLGGGSDPEKADGTPEVSHEKWPEARNVRADLIRWIFVDREARVLVDPRGVLILGARITGTLDLSYTTAFFPLVLLRCRLEQPLYLIGAKMAMLSLEGSWTKAIGAHGLRMETSIFLTNGFHAEGGVWMPGATIGGILDATGGTLKNLNGIALNAEGIKVTGSVFLQRGFSVEGEVWLPDATIGGDLLAEGATFKNSKGTALNAERIRVVGSVFLRNGFSAEGEALLLSATIGGDLDAVGGTFKNLKSDNNPSSTGRALSADHIEVKGAVLLGKPFTAEGSVGLNGAIIARDLDANGGTFRNSNGNALIGDGIKVGGSIFLGNDFNASGEVRLVGATIDGQLNARRGTFRNSNGNALSADGIKVKGDIFLDNGFSADGEVRLPNATIGSNLDTSGGTFKNSGGDALNADYIKVGGDAHFGRGFIAEGEVRLRGGATIGGDLDATGATFKNLKSDKNPNSTAHALGADRVNVTGSVFLRDGFSAEGEVRLPGAIIGGNLEATGGSFKNPDGNALFADRIEVDGNVLLNDKFFAEGTLRLPDAEIKGQLGVVDAELDELNLQSAHIVGPFFWRNIEIRAWSVGSHALDLNGARVGALDDDEGSWPKKGGLVLDGFVYDRIAGAPTDAKTRLKWLGLQPDGYFPQPYEQLIVVLRQMGHEDQVADVAIAKQWDLRKHGNLGWSDWILNWLLFLVVGYGYRGWLAFIWILLLVGFGSCVFSHAHSAKVLVPSDQDAYTEYEKSKMEKLPRYYPRFHLFLYSLDVVFPFDLGQKAHWRLIERRPGHRGFWWYESWSLIQLIAGWVLLLVAAAVPAGLIK